MDNFDEIKALISNRICGVCEQQPQQVCVSNVGGNVVYGMRCKCGVDKASLVKPTSYAKRRLGRMVKQAMEVRRDSTPVLSVKDVQRYISPHATEVEGEIFLRFCQAQDLDPFRNEVYLIKYDKGAKAAIVIGIQAYLKRAAGNPNYAGYNSGVIVLDKEGNPHQRDGSIQYPNDTLIGGWANVYRKDWPQPLKVTVLLSEYDKNQALWKTMKGTLIEVRAISQGLRRAFPSEYEGLSADIDDMSIEVGDAIPQVDTVTGEIQGPPTEPDLMGLFPEPAQQAPQRPAQAQETVSAPGPSPSKTATDPGASQAKAASIVAKPTVTVTAVPTTASVDSDVIQDGERMGWDADDENIISDNPQPKDWHIPNTMMSKPAFVDWCKLNKMTQLDVTRALGKPASQWIAETNSSDYRVAAVDCTKVWEKE